MENKKVIIGGILGIGLLIGLVWFLFFRKGKTGKTVVANVLQPNQPAQASQPQKQVVYVNSGGNSASAFPLRQGSKGAEVRALQEALNKAGFNVGAADGAWGANTQKGFVAAFPNKFGVNDFKEFETILADLAKRTGSTSTSTSATSTEANTGIKIDSRYRGVQFRVTTKAPVSKTAGGPPVAYYEQSDKIVLTGRWQRVAGEIWSEFERHNNNGLAWIKDIFITRV
ncbi:MAG: hypothetical protein OHK0045_25450 [Raineya sp.]